MAEKFIYQDKDGQLVLNADGTISLRLLKERRTRHLGSIQRSTKGNMIYRKHEQKKNTFRKLNAWGINNNIVNFLNTDQAMVIIYTEKGHYWITKARIKEHGQYLHFKKQGGYELQIFVPKMWWSFIGHYDEPEHILDCWDRYDDWRDAQKEPK